MYITTIDLLGRSPKVNAVYLFRPVQKVAPDYDIGCISTVSMLKYCLNDRVHGHWSMVIYKLDPLYLNNRGINIKHIEDQ